MNPAIVVRRFAMDFIKATVLGLLATAAGLAFLTLLAVILDSVP